MQKLKSSSAGVADSAGAAVTQVGSGPGLMDREWRDEWIRALRSGEFKQIRDRLRNARNGRCCLGVLCDIRPDVKWHQGGDASVDGDDRNDTMLPFGLGQAVGIKWDIENMLTSMNDEGKSFDEIADWIEANL